ncbi:hypothetical protein [Kordia sp.]|uniref:hypothetical protein n=1 Tax=Kordia sp. TaxID=1965332 RepID=UPI003B5CB6E6
MKKYTFTSTLFVIIFMLQSCSFLTSEETETQNVVQIEREQKELDESVYSYKVLLWKYLKMSQKSTYITEDTHADLLPMKTKFSKISNVLNAYNNQTMMEELSAFDYVDIYKDFNETKEYIKTTDEDIMPSYSEFYNTENTALSAEEISNKRSMEHMMFAGLSLLSRDAGREIALYEASKIDMDNVTESETKCFYRLFRGFLFFEKGLNHLSEKELTANINWIENTPNADFRSVLGPYSESLTQQQAYEYMLSTNYLIRGLDRLFIGGETTEKAVQEDFQGFLTQMEKLGIQTEVTAAIETYVNLKNENSAEAIQSLSKLKQSKLLSDKERATIDEAIVYLQERESGKVLNTIYDKYFLSKIVTKYSWNVISEFDWKKFTENNTDSYSDALLEKIKTAQTYVENISKYTSEEGIKETGEQLKQEGEKLWDKAKELWNEN